MLKNKRMFIGLTAAHFIITIVVFILWYSWSNSLYNFNTIDSSGIEPLAFRTLSFLTLIIMSPLVTLFYTILGGAGSAVFLFLMFFNSALIAYLIEFAWERFEKVFAAPSK